MELVKGRQLKAGIQIEICSEAHHQCVKVGTQTRKLRGQRQQGYDEKKVERGKAQSKKKNWQQQKNKKERKKR
jgi:hypothetical protein